MRPAGATLALILALGAGAPMSSAQPDVFPRASERGKPERDERDVNLGSPDADAERVADLIGQLGDPEFAEREAASRELAELCPGAFRLMARTYREGDDYETRIRVQQIVQEQYLWHTLLKRNGFLGVGYSRQGFERLPDESLAVRITHVEPGSAADEADLRKNDLIRSIDGEPFTNDGGENTFRDKIQTKGAGGKATLEVVRGSESLILEVTLRARPIAQYADSPLLDELNARMQDYAIWWNRHFGLPAPRTRRTPSTAVLELPE